ASILKVPIMSVAIKEGLETMYGEYSGKQLVFAMGKYSDNEATTTLVDSLGEEKIQSEIEDMGMDHTLFSQNTTIPLDIVEMWKAIYKKPEIWEYFQDSIFEDRIAPVLTPNHQLIHKVGTDEGVWTDAGIIQCPVLSAQCSVKPYILVILNKDTNREEAEKTVPEIAELIVNYEAEYARQKLPPPASSEGKLK
ncbi:MAG: serine hydrolase, partial [Candidatus Amesbacteria bacterium]|nr:serine hydrolase [Candidatus Amesbacteria bacterium]